MQTGCQTWSAAWEEAMSQARIRRGKTEGVGVRFSEWLGGIALHHYPSIIEKVTLQLLLYALSCSQVLLALLS
eukprot:795263-Amphidinium_carterae.2